MNFRNVICNIKIFFNVWKCGEHFYELHIKIIAYSSFCIVTLVARRKVWKTLAYRKWK